MTLDLLLIGLVIALEPLPMSAYLLVLGSERGIRKGLGFVLGWLLTVVGLVVLTLLLTGGEPLTAGSAPSRAALVAKVLLGAGLLAFAWRTRARRGRRTATQPRWMARLDTLGFLAAMALGFLLQPWALVAAGVATVSEANLSSGATVVTLVAFCVLSSASYLTMQGYAMLSPRTARVRLDGLNSWIALNRDEVAVVLSVAIGLWLILASTYQLAA